MARFSTSFSNENVDVEFIAYHYKTTINALIEFYNTNNKYFAGYLSRELDEEFGHSSRELELNYCLSLLASVEAAARIDYLVCVANKFKDSVSISLREIFQKKQNKAPFEDILETWKTKGNCKGKIITDLKGATNYRHWLAHGRYWVPKHGRVYDFDILYSIAKGFIGHISQYRNSFNQLIA